MKNIDIIVMGKTGAGKSTLINAVLEEDLAPTGTGQAVTRENRVYTRRMLLPLGGDGNGGYGLQNCQLNMYDTVGLEIDSSITQKTLQEIRRHIEDTKAKMSSDDIHLVWFCVNDRSNRFEPYEIDLIRQLSIDYEIPFMIVLTQCFSGEQGELSAMIQETLPEIPLKRVLAKDYETRAGVIRAHGVSELLKASATEYRHLKADILIKKLRVLNEVMKKKKENKKKTKDIEEKGNEEIEKYVAKAEKAGIIPGIGIPAVYGICIRMVKELNDLAGLKADQEFADEIFEDVVLGLMVAPFMLLPGVSALAAGAYVSTVGEAYLKALLGVMDESSDQELEDNDLVRERLKKELIKIKE